MMTKALPFEEAEDMAIEVSPGSFSADRLGPYTSAV
jgi:hypothetical protein